MRNATNCAWRQAQPFCGLNIAPLTLAYKEIPLWLDLSALYTYSLSLRTVAGSLDRQTMGRPYWLDAVTTICHTLKCSFHSNSDVCNFANGELNLQRMQTSCLSVFGLLTSHDPLASTTRAHAEAPICGSAQSTRESCLRGLQLCLLSTHTCSMTLSVNAFRLSPTCMHIAVTTL